VPGVIEGDSGRDHVAQDGSRRFNWAGLPLIATIARLLLREEEILWAEYFRVQYKVVRWKVPGRIRFSGP
jgi:hypothetical protein